MKALLRRNEVKFAAAFLSSSSATLYFSASISQSCEHPGTADRWAMM
jgi:hypothetical protein